ncbi:MAG: lipoate--protein ligase family protein [Pirellulaceae bacterium]
MMKLLAYSPSTPEENLALDEAILEQAECGAGPSEVLRLWEPSRPLVVVGRSSRVTVEVNEMACAQAGIPILRRCSGGAAVVTGPGCLMYSVVLAYRRRPELRILDQAHGFVLGVMSRALSGLAADVVMRGTSDLVRGDRKFSGNSLRCKREHLLYHGTILYNFPLDLIGRCLGIPPRQPAYRLQRAHTAFVANFPATQDRLITCIQDAWGVDELLSSWPQQKVAELVATRYSQASWNLRL